jgi:hypothetical protein
MIESITIVTITLLLLAYFRPGKTPPLENALSIERSGKYTIALAAKLNLAQPFVERVAERIRLSISGMDGGAIQYFIVRDRQVKAHGSDIYLLAIGCRNQMLYFFAANPKGLKPNEYLDAIKASSFDFLKDFPVSDSQESGLNEIIANMTLAIAKETGIEVKTLIK